jgi:flagellar basal body rod protein FlgG
MGDGIYVALSGAVNQQLALETTAQNLANAQTGGYQRMRPVFREVLSQANGALRATTTAATAIDTSMGPVRQTGRTLDAALPEGTYLAVQTPRGERYTRAAALDIARDGTLVTKTGLAVVGENGKPIRAQASTGVQVSLGAEGEVTQGSEVIGRMKLVCFKAPERLTREGATLLATSTESGPAAVKPAKLEVGALEDSNASPIACMGELVQATRHFEAYEKAIDAFRQIDEKAASRLGAAG